MNRSLMKCCNIIITSQSKPIIDTIPRFFTTLELTSCGLQKLDSCNRSIKECSIQNSDRNFHTSSLCHSEDYYKILGISRNATKRDIKKAYFDLARKCHPDTNNNDSSLRKKFQLISEAYEVLSNEEKKQNYDAYGHMDTDGNPFATAGAHRGNWNHQATMDPEEFFRSIFGDFASKGFNNQYSDDSFADSAFGFGSTTEATLTVSFTEAARGVKKQVHMNVVDACPICRGTGSMLGSRPTKCIICNGSGLETITTGPFLMKQTCRSCRGKGHTVKNPCGHCDGKGKVVQRKDVTVPVPAGVEHGQTLRMTIGSKEVFIKISVQKSNYFKRDGYDVHTDVCVSLSQAVLGGRVKIRGVYGDIELDIPTGTHSHSRLRLRGKGVKRLNSNGQGDHYCHVKISIPTFLSKEENELMTAFAELEVDTPGTITGFTSTNKGHISKSETEMLKQLRSVIDGTLKKDFLDTWKKNHQNYDKDETIRESSSNGESREENIKVEKDPNDGNKKVESSG